MSTHSKPKTRSQLRHPASRSKSHQRDKREGEARQKTAWIGVEAPCHPSPERSFGPLQGHEYIHENGQWQRCTDPEAFANYLEGEARRRGWFMDTTQRKGVPVAMKRTVAAPLDILTVTFPPWLSDWTAEEIAAQRDPRPKLAAARNHWLAGVQTLLTGMRHLLGFACHMDTDDPHFDLALSRQDGAGGRIGEAGLGLAGPWTVGVDRQLRAHAEIDPDKRRQMQRNVAKYRQRYGQEAIPLDVALARAFDAAAVETIGPELLRFREAYAARVPELERQHTLAKLAALQAAEGKLRENLAPEPTAPAPEPEPERAMPEPEPNFPSLG